MTIKTIKLLINIILFIMVLFGLIIILKIVQIKKQINKIYTKNVYIIKYKSI